MQQPDNPQPDARQPAPDAPPLVGIIMGSRSDWETMRHATDTLDTLGVPYEVRVASVHRTPDLVREYSSSAEARCPSE